MDKAETLLRLAYRQVAHLCARQHFGYYITDPGEITVLVSETMKLYPVGLTSDHVVFSESLVNSGFDAKDVASLSNRPTLITESISKASKIFIGLKLETRSWLAELVDNYSRRAIVKLPEKDAWVHTMLTCSKGELYATDYIWDSREIVDISTITKPLDINELHIVLDDLNTPLEISKTLAGMDNILALHANDKLHTANNLYL